MATRCNSLTALRFIPLLCMMGLIFMLSHMPGRNLPDLGIMGIDKIVHALVFATLALTALFALQPLLANQPRRVLLISAWLLCAVYGVSDEWHQSMVPLRTPSGLDVLADMSGAALAIAAWFARHQPSRHAGRL